jgi:hypothetical protein
MQQKGRDVSWNLTIEKLLEAIVECNGDKADVDLTRLGVERADLIAALLYEGRAGCCPQWIR